jgi:hypothetical protein
MAMMSVMSGLNYLYTGHLMDGINKTLVKLYSLKLAFHGKNETSRNNAG